MTHALGGERCHVCLDLISRHEPAHEEELIEGIVAVHDMCWETTTIFEISHRTKLFQIREPGQDPVVDCLHKKGG